MAGILSYEAAGYADSLSRTCVNDGSQVKPGYSSRVAVVNVRSPICAVALRLPSAIRSISSDSLPFGMKLLLCQKSIERGATMLTLRELF